MENASKALLTVGAILLAIVIISFGIILFKNNAKQSDSNSNTNDKEIQEYNERFTTYVGEKKSGDEVQSLIEMIMASNANESKNETGRSVTFFYGNVAYSPSSGQIPNIDTSKTYTVTAKYNDGVITEITIK